MAQYEDRDRRGGGRQAQQNRDEHYQNRGGDPNRPDYRDDNRHRRYGYQADAQGPNQGGYPPFERGAYVPDQDWREFDYRPELGVGSRLGRHPGQHRAGYGQWQEHDRPGWPGAYDQGGVVGTAPRHFEDWERDVSGRDPRRQQHWYQQGGRRDETSGQFDPDYAQWREEQMRAFDDDYHTWRKDRYQRFSDEFTQWRSQRNTKEPQSEAAGNATTGAVKKDKP